MTDMTVPTQAEALAALSILKLGRDVGSKQVALLQAFIAAHSSGEPVAWRLTHEDLEVDEGFLARPDKNGAWAAQGFKVEPLYASPPARGNGSSQDHGAANAAAETPPKVTADMALGALTRMKVILRQLQPALNLMARDVLDDIIKDQIDPFITEKAK